MALWRSRVRPSYAPPYFPPYFRLRSKSLILFAHALPTLFPGFRAGNGPKRGADARLLRCRNPVTGQIAHKGNKWPHAIPSLRRSSRRPGRNFAASKSCHLFQRKQEAGVHLAEQNDGLKKRKPCSLLLWRRGYALLYICGKPA